ncbi:bifunctional 2-polyprenyl-6-hydroxyphenol methylase/3-demethylubiquinol 3-O-methyltransferase UbiG [Erythrobacter sp. EC-HK427]|uniref:bifunctional 2-polyprenyl-6-hydroxyphenol methylase/3-demethylubiquinol 3-O-methyltransferase UbiG n=1 Tax=Erythrobacter sp. EC-HK427 TaxID=2038396 RepID=UPI00125BEB2B|nr:bifunctional 2-polyprenyl-6-hydroxyphenol methylase/3-demethylubiquinol 3-O-methyltransferase UbiG [Erythrobacter sp. EC-HK427]VVT01388.1 Ubiquinone biosynthesis O-methyltransferase [Erythrobacter sp. EC-HK427]
MSDATVTSETSSATIRPEEAAHFGKLAREWWDPKGSSAMLHKLNPVRLGFLRAAIDLHWGGDVQSVKPLAGKTALDVGCGAGLLCEPLARMGAEVTGVDAASENIAAAKAHAAGMGLLAPLPSGEGLGVGGPPSVDVAPPSPTPSPKGRGFVAYHAGELGALGLGPFDLVTSMEVIEHVADKAAFLAGLAAHLAPDGLLVMSTPNRTLASRALLVEGAEALGAVPKGTHHWEDFVTPDELTAMLEATGLAVTRMQGIAFSPMKGLHLSEDMALNYILSARRA